MLEERGGQEKAVATTWTAVGAVQLLRAAAVVETAVVGEQLVQH